MVMLLSLMHQNETVNSWLYLSSFLVLITRALLDSEERSLNAPKWIAKTGLLASFPSVDSLYALTVA